MKLYKVLVLALLLISVFALATLSRTSQDANSISVDEKQDCTMNYYNETVNVYGYVKRERNLYGRCLHYQNYTSCLNTSGSNTDCSAQNSIYNTTCMMGTKSYQSHEITGTQIVLKNTTDCRTTSYTVSTTNGGVTELKLVDFSAWGICVNSKENGCLAITCGTLKGGSARNGIFNGCDGGKSCEKFLFCPGRVQVLYKGSGNNFVAEDPTFHLDKLALKEVGK